MALNTFLSQAWSSIFGRPASTPAIQITSMQPIAIGGPAIYPDPNALNYIQKAYCGNGSIYTIVSTAARKFSYIPRYVYKISNQKAYDSYRSLQKVDPKNIKKILEYRTKAYDETQVTDGDLAVLLNRPNPDQGQDTFLETIYTYYKVTGEAFIYLNRGDIAGLTDQQILKRKIVEMTVMPTQFVYLIPDPQDKWGITGYLFMDGGIPQTIPKSCMIHWKKPNPNYNAYTREHLRGLSPLQPGNKLVTQDDSNSDAMVANNQNLGARGVLSNEVLGSMSAEQQTQIKAVVDNKINNRDNRGAVATLNGKWTYQEIGQTSEELQLLEGQEKTLIRLCNLFGVPPELFVTQNTYDNKDMARRDLITSLILPEACSLRDEMNRLLLPAFGYSPGQYTHDVDITDLPELQEDMSKKVTQLMQAWWLTPNQRLTMMNEDTSTDANMDKVWVPNNLVMMDDVGQLDSFTIPPKNGTDPTNQPAN